MWNVINDENHYFGVSPALVEASDINRFYYRRLSEAEYEIRDMYALYPDFEVDVKRGQEILTAAQRIIFQFPMYWYSSPALLKKWLDDVLEHGWAYGSQGCALRGKELGIAVTTGAKSAEYAHDGGYRYTVTDLLRLFQATADFTGMKFSEPFVTYGTLNITPQVREAVWVRYLNYLQADGCRLGV